MRKSVLYINHIPTKCHYPNTIMCYESVKESASVIRSGRGMGGRDGRGARSPVTIHPQRRYLCREDKTYNNRDIQCFQKMHHVLESSVGTGLVFILVSYKSDKDKDTHLHQEIDNFKCGSSFFCIKYISCEKEKTQSQRCVYLFSSSQLKYLSPLLIVTFQKTFQLFFYLSSFYKNSKYFLIIYSHLNFTLIMTGTGPGLRYGGADGDGQTVQGNIFLISFIFKTGRKTIKTHFRRDLK